MFILKIRLLGTDLLFCPLKNKSYLILRDTLLTENIYKASLKILSQLLYKDPHFWSWKYIWILSFICNVTVSPNRSTCKLSAYIEVSLTWTWTDLNLDLYRIFFFSLLSAPDLTLLDAPPWYKVEWYRWFLNAVERLLAKIQLIQNPNLVLNQDT